MRFAAAFLALALFASCDKPETTEPDPDAPGTEIPDDPDGPGSGDEDTPDGPAYPENANTFVVDGVETPVGSTFAFTYEGFLTFMATPQETTFEEAFDGEYIQMLFLPSFYNQDVDLKENPLQIYVWDNETETYEITGDMLESGSARLNHEDGSDTYTLLVYMKFNDGTEVGINATATMAEEEAPEDGSTITINGTTNPVRAAFYYDDSGTTFLYFTAGDIDYFYDDIFNVHEYVYIFLNEDDLTGNEIDITTSDKYFELGYENQASGEENSLYITTGDLLGATGTVSVTRNGLDPTRFTAKMSVTFGDGTKVDLDFDGVCKSTDETAQIPNEFTCNGSTEDIKSILVDKSGTDIWKIYMSSIGGVETVSEFESFGSFVITAPAEAFNIGEGVGFSTYKDTLKFEYEGQTWAYPDTGTLEAYLEGDQLTLDFTTYGDVKGHYEGPAIIVE